MLVPAKLQCVGVESPTGATGKHEDGLTERFPASSVRLVSSDMVASLPNSIGLCLWGRGVFARYQAELSDMNRLRDSKKGYRDGKAALETQSGHRGLCFV